MKRIIQESQSKDVHSFIPEDGTDMLSKKTVTKHKTTQRKYPGK